MNILIIDDNPEITGLTKPLLEGNGHHVSTIETIEELKNEKEIQGYSLIFLDKSIKQINLKTVQSMRPPNVKSPVIVAFTAQDNDNPDSHINEGFDDVLSKPFTPQDLYLLTKKYS